MMKHIMTIALCAMTISAAAQQKQDVMTKEGNVTVINTTSLSKDVRGYRATTPVKIYIKKNKVEKVEALRNQETPKYFVQAKKLLEQYAGLSVKKAQNTKVDAVSGATMSSKALTENVKRGLEYYQKNK